MSRGGPRTALVLSASLAILVLAPGAAQASRAMPRTPRAGDFGCTPAGATLPYCGGPVLHWNRTHVIFWAPRGSGLRFDPGYKPLIETFLRNVARASRSTTSTYGLIGQYRDQNGPAAYASIYGGAVTATDPLPRNGCRETPRPTGPGWKVCLTDEQLQHEIERVVRRDRLPTSANDVYFLVTPDGLGSCEYTGSSTCALGGSVNGYCGYHSQTDDGLVLYAVIPYNAVPGHCESDNPRPNGNPADPALSTISHENIETVTDPLGNAWINLDTGNEMADLCLTTFGPDIDGSSGPSAWNEDINGGHYFLQEIWSNYNGGCEPRAKPDPLTFQTGPLSGHPSSAWFAARANDPEGRIVGYRWFFGDGRTARGKWAAHRYAHPGQYRVILRTTDSWGNWAFYAATLRVSRAGG